MQILYHKAICRGCGKASECKVLGMEGPYMLPELPWVAVIVRNQLYPAGRVFYACSDECRFAVLKEVDRHTAELFEMLQGEDNLKKAQELATKTQEEMWARPSGGVRPVEITKRRDVAR